MIPEHGLGDKKFDIHVTGNAWCLVVENKIDDSPWPDQRAKYQAYCDGLRKRGQQAWLVYITPHFRKPLRSIRHWISYADVRSLLESLTPSDAAKPLIDQFCEHVSQL